MESKVPMALVVIGGPMKTGTSALAAALTQLSRVGGLPKGFSYPVDRYWLPRFRDEKIVKHHAIGDYLEPRMHETLNYLFKEWGESITPENTHEGLHRVITTWEGMARALCRSPHRAKSLIAALEEIFVTVEVVFIRRDSDRALRSLAQQLLRGPRAAFHLADIDFRRGTIRPDSQLALPYDEKTLAQAISNAGICESTFFIEFSELTKREPSLLLNLFDLFQAPEFEVTASRMGSEEIHTSFGRGIFNLLFIAAWFQRLLGDSDWTNRMRLSFVDWLVKVRARKARARRYTTW